MKMKNPLEPAGRTALEASRELLALEPEEKALALRLMAAGVRSAAEKIVRENGLDMEEARKGGRNAACVTEAARFLVRKPFRRKKRIGPRNMKT